MSGPALFACLSYREAAAALNWLAALRFEIVTRQDRPANTVVRSALRLGSVVLMVASDDAGYDVPALKGRSTGHGLYLWVADVDDMYDRALAAGARAVFPPESTEWGSRRARLLDPEGHEWSFGSYEPGQRWA